MTGVTGEALRPGIRAQHVQMGGGCGPMTFSSMSAALALGSLRTLHHPPCPPSLGQGPVFPRLPRHPRCWLPNGWASL